VTFTPGQVVKVNCDTPFLSTSSVLPFAVKRHLSPAMIRGTNDRTRVKLPPGFNL